MARRRQAEVKFSRASGLRMCDVVKTSSSLCRQMNLCIKQINNLFFDFLWNSKGDKIKTDVITQDYGNGGLKMIDIASFNKALKVAQ